MIDSMPQPPGFFLLTYIGPHFVHLCCFDPVNPHLNGLSVQLLQQWVIHRLKLAFFFFSLLMTVSVLMLKTRAVSRIPLPFMARSIICRFTEGMEPGWYNPGEKYDKRRPHLGRDSAAYRARFFHV
jgi:hypothetical protein